MRPREWRTQTGGDHPVENNFEAKIGPSKPGHAFRRSPGAPPMTGAPEQSQVEGGIHMK
jgi:hypothetical protein